MLSIVLFFFSVSMKLKNFNLRIFYVENVANQLSAIGGSEFLKVELSKYVENSYNVCTPERKQKYG